jgi:hypothetical protein
VPATEPREIRFGLNRETIGDFIVAVRVLKLRLRQCHQCFADFVFFSLVKFSRSLER